MTTLEDEILILKEDMLRQKQIIEALREENWDLKNEVKMIRSDSMEFKTFSIESSEAIEELFNILNETEDFTYIINQDAEIFNKSYYIYSKLGNLIFIIENDNDNKTLLITPPLSNISRDNRMIYETYTFNWNKYSSHCTRRKMIINGQTHGTILNLLNKFK